MCVHVNALHDDCLLPVFDYIPLAELMRLDQVCRRWASLFLKACERRRTLVLIVGGYRLERTTPVFPYSDQWDTIVGGEPHYDLPVEERECALTLPYLLPQNHNDLFGELRSDPLVAGYELDGFFDILYRPDGPALTEVANMRDARLSGQLVNYLGDLFPKVNTLVVVHSRCFENELHSVIGLLGIWRLKSLKLWVNNWAIDQRYVDRPAHHPAGTLLERLNQQPNLRQLTLDMNSYRPVNGPELEFAFPADSLRFISRLQVARLNLNCYDRANSLWATVHRFASPALRQIALGTENTVEPALAPQFEFTNRVDQLCCDWSFDDSRQLSQLCSRFGSLTMLKMYWRPNITFADLVANLATLPRLAYLKMNIYFEDHPALSAFGGTQDRARIVSLPQVRILDFKVMKLTHWDFCSLSSKVFPSVVLVILESKRYLTTTQKVSECPACQYRNTGGPLHYRKANRCHRLMALSLRSKFTNPSLRMYADDSILEGDDDSDDGAISGPDDCGGDVVNKGGDDGDQSDSRFKRFKRIASNLWSLVTKCNFCC